MESKGIPFIEIFDNIPGKGIDVNIWNSCYEGCECSTCFVEDSQISSKCVCVGIMSQNNNYDTQYRLNVNYFDKNWSLNLFPINECHSECACTNDRCSNRVVQNGPYFNFEVFNCEITAKGKGLRTRDFIPKGSFVIEYMGEVISLDVAKNLFEIRSGLSEPNYIMFLKEFYSNKMCMASTVIDARNYSNFGRYINHSCEPNLFVLPVRIENLVPHAALFSLRDIYAGEELCYDYNGSVGISQIEVDLKKEKTSIECFCGSSKCTGFLPMTDLNI
uniref:Histone-lysine N-methyltransferase SETMAR-2 n=1 Tax=Brachionus koreanus TaxID=1199090 RepID=A0A513TZH7_9BILA|nr:histone-lysine N-methyltransferase SETMAR-2 [Brachionus koreanus]